MPYNFDIGNNKKAICVIIKKERFVKMIQLEELIDEFTKDSMNILHDNLVGVYLHGSSVMGCFNPDKSDLDFIIVVKKPMSDDIKRAYMEMVVKHSALGPSKGIEMSVVLENVCKPFVYPTPFELHFSIGHLDWYKEDPDDYIKKMNGKDKDLAAHFTIINKRGKCLYGLPIKEVFGEVPKNDYMDSIWYDVENAKREITTYPMYLILNLARVLAYNEEGLVLSKKEGGEWALRNLPNEYHSLIQDALGEYLENKQIIYDKALAKRYAKYMIKRIKLNRKKK